MTNKRSPALFELAADSGSEPFEAAGLKGRTNFQSRAPRSGTDFKAMALARLREAGADVERSDFEIDGLPVDALVRGPNGRRFLVLARGTPAEHKQSGLRRTDTVEKVGFMAMQLARRQALPILLMTSDLPRKRTKADRYLSALSDDVWDVIGYRSDLRGFLRLREHLGGSVDAPRPQAQWRMPEKPNERQLFDSDTCVFPAADSRAGASGLEVSTQDPQHR